MHYKYSSLGFVFLIVLLAMLPACSTQTTQTINTQIRTEWNQLNQNLAKKKRSLTDREKEMVKQVVQAYSTIPKHKIRLTGRVTDTEGKPLEKVRIRASYNRLASVGPVSDMHYAKTYSDENGYYQLKVDHHIAMCSWYLKGYYRKEMTKSWGKFTTKKIIAALERGSSIVELNDFVNGLNITFTPKGDVTVLDKRSGRLKVSPLGPLNVFRYNRKDNSKKHLAQAAKYGTGFFEIKQKSSEKNKKTLPEKGFYIELPVDEKNNIKFHDKYHYYPGKPYVAWLRIHAVGKGFGLQLAMKPGESLERNKLRFKEAPVDGYKHVIELTAKDLAAHNGHAYLWFYVKANGKYGRMNFDNFNEPLQSKKKSQIYSASVDMQVQPDGSRNLETGN